MFINRIAIIGICIGGTAMGQTTVSFESMGWKDFGTTTETGLVGNFIAGWTSLNATPDIGVNVFSAPNQSLTGAADDAAVWLNHFDEGAAPAHNEVVGLSLSGFTIGESYQLTFHATLLLQTAYGWTGNDEALEVGISGADISTWATTSLVDVGDTDGMNIWVAQSIEFVAMSSVVGFDFGAGAIAPDLGGSTARIGIDGFDMGVVPSPSALAFLGLGGVFAGRRRR